MEKLKIFSERLKALRQDKGLTQRELAESVGMTASSFSAYENGTKTPSLSVAIAISDTYDVSLDWLIGREAKEDTPLKSDDYAEILTAFTYLLDNNRIINVTINREDDYSYPSVEIQSRALADFIVSITRYEGLYHCGELTSEEYGDLVRRSIERRASQLSDELKEPDTTGWDGESY